MHTTRISFIKHLGTGEADAWNELEQIYQPLIVNWLRRFQLQDNDAQDLTQEVMLVLAQQIGQFEHSGNVGAFRNWLRTTTVNLAHNYLRKTKKELAQAVGSDTFLEMLHQLADPDSDISREFRIEHDRLVVRRLLEQVKERFEPVTLEIFRLHVVQGVGARETAQELGVSVASVHTAKSRVLRQLRAQAADLIEEMYVS